MFLFLSLLSLTTAHAEIIPGFTYEKNLKGKDDRGSFNITYVQISPRAFPIDSLRRPVNYVIAKMARESICEADPERRENMESNLTMKVNVANREALSIDVGQDYYCGGAHPDGGTSSYLYDLRTGKEVSFDSQIINATAFKSFVITKVLANVPADSEDCKDLYTREQLENEFFNYSVRGDKLVATQSYAHVAQACAFDTDVNYADIAAFVKPGSTLSRIIR